MSDRESPPDARPLIGETARGRTYRRKFDHDEARVQLASGKPIAEIARALGVTYAAIYRLANPEVEQRAQAVYRAKLKCEGCGKAMTHNLRLHADNRLLCTTCRGVARRTRFSEIGGVLHARCVSCHEDKPLRAFTAGVSYKDIRPNGVHCSCTSCQTQDKRNWRRKRRAMGLTAS